MTDDLARRELPARDINLSVFEAGCKLAKLRQQLNSTVLFLQVHRKLALTIDYFRHANAETVGTPAWPVPRYTTAPIAMAPNVSDISSIVVSIQRRPY